jgi:hypothetical protein
MPHMGVLQNEVEKRREMKENRELKELGHFLQFLRFLRFLDFPGLLPLPMLYPSGCPEIMARACLLEGKEEGDGAPSAASADVSLF